MKKMLIIGYVWPEPNSSAAGSHMLQLISFFQAQGYAITFTSPAQQTEHMVDLTELDVLIEPITLNCDSFDDFIGQLKPELVLFDRFMMEEQFGWRVSMHCPQAMKILDTEDLFCLRHARHDAYKQQRIITDNDLLTSDLAKREVAAIFRCDLSLLVSQVEIALLTRLFKVDKALLHYFPFAFNELQHNQENPEFEQRVDFISIGNFRHPPNWDAVLWLKQQIWPLIRAQLPKANLLVCGAYPPPKATQLHDVKSGFLVKGWVEDANLAMQSARICLAPLRFGAGIKGKLAEAMLCGTPSITTDVGAEGMQSDTDWGGHITELPQVFADAAVALYHDKTAWQLASKNGQKNAQSLFNQTQHFEHLKEVLLTLSQNLEQHRQVNFIGSMLNHHHHKSTKYMAQWIAAKNQLVEIQGDNNN